MKVDSLFPNYEVMESKYLADIRDREGNWRFDTSPHLEEIGMSHYAILKSINYINISTPQIGVGDPHQRYKNIYFHFGLLFDTVENMARNIVLTKAQLKIEEFKSKVMKSNDVLLADFQNFVKTRYKKAFLNMVKYGKPIFYYPQHPKNFISILINNKPLKNDYRRFEKAIKDYRNFYIHKPGVDIAINSGTRQLFAIKKEFITNHEYRYWSYIRESIQKQSRADHFDNPISIVKGDLEQCLGLFNKIYGSFLNAMEVISGNDDYKTLLYNFERTSYNIAEVNKECELGQRTEFLHDLKTVFDTIWMKFKGTLGFQRSAY